jgi:hypothetical protein
MGRERGRMSGGKTRSSGDDRWFPNVLDYNIDFGYT